MTTTVSQLRRVHGLLDQLGRRAALVGGLAVSVRTHPRFTRDLELAVAVVDDHDAEALARALTANGFQIEPLIEQTDVGRIATVRLRPPDFERHGVIVDLLLASSGIEPEVVAAAEPLMAVPGVTALGMHRATSGPPVVRGAPAGRRCAARAVAHQSRISRASGQEAHDQGGAGARVQDVIRCQHGPPDEAQGQCAARPPRPASAAAAGPR